jgi:hypothetical protein
MEKRFAFTQDVQAGDCWLQAGSSIVFRSDGSGHWDAKTKTTFTHSKDYWHEVVQAFSTGNTFLFATQEMTSPPMDSPNAVPPSYWYYWGNDFYFDKNQYPLIDHVLSHAAC